MDRRAIENTVNRFTTCFDTKNWDVMSSTLGAEMTVDYADLRGEPAYVTKRRDYIDLRMAAQGHTKTHHLMSNLVIGIEGEVATVDASCMIFRMNEGEFFNSHAIYQFQLNKVSGDWLIVSIKQSILWNDGNPNLHKGVPKF